MDQGPVACALAEPADQALAAGDRVVLIATPGWPVANADILVPAAAIALDTGVAERRIDPVALRVPRRRFLASGAALPGARRASPARATCRNRRRQGDNRAPRRAGAHRREWRRRRRAAAEAAKTKKLDAVAAALAEPPRDEKSFKRLFDEYSSDVSYKQKYMDSNAFVVYYTKGFDGRTGPTSRTTPRPSGRRQFGFRNDAWAAVDDARRGRLPEVRALVARGACRHARPRDRGHGGHPRPRAAEDAAAARKAGR
ncbi:hypothetical protein JL720_10010 [Aureococcus anophagefferens]|nr:hypothetical protein JL720_10010 [Aureococcus anophagefferens]